MSLCDSGVVPESHARHLVLRGKTFALTAERLPFTA